MFCWLQFVCHATGRYVMLAAVCLPGYWPLCSVGCSLFARLLAVMFCWLQFVCHAKGHYALFAAVMFAMLMPLCSVCHHYVCHANGHYILFAAVMFAMLMAITFSLPPLCLPGYWLLCSVGCSLFARLLAVMFCRLKSLFSQCCLNNQRCH